MKILKGTQFFVWAIGMAMVLIGGFLFEGKPQVILLNTGMALMLASIFIVYWRRKHEQKANSSSATGRK